MKQSDISKIFIFFIFLINMFTLKANALVEPTSEFYVNDYANVLTSSTEKYIIENSKRLNDIDGTQIVVVTVPNLGGESIEDYSLALAREFGIGSKEKNNGLLILLALEERLSRVEVGTGLEGILPDGKTGRFQDTFMIPYFKKNDFDNGIKQGYNVFFNEIVSRNNLGISLLEVSQIEPLSLTHVDTGYLLLMTCLAWGVGAFFGINIKFSKNKQKWTLVYIFIWASISLLILYLKKEYFVVCLLNLIFFLISRYLLYYLTKIDSSGGSSNHHRSSRSSSHSSSHSSSGGGGSFSGGGSTRRF